MSKISTFFGAAALLVSVSAFAQSTTTPVPNDTPHDTKVAPSNSAPMSNNTMNTTTPANNPPAASTASPSPMASSDMASSDKNHAKMHHKHRTETARNSTDNDADKLNACMAYATPTSSQEQCLRKASQS